MYIYNITISVDESVREEWLIWVRSHILKVLETGRFTKAKLTRVLIEEEMGGITYSVQYTAKTRKDLDDYYKYDAPKLRRDGINKFADKALFFRTELEVINEFFPQNNID